MNLLDLLSSPFAMSRSAHAEMIEIYLTHLRGEKIDIAGLEAKLGAPLRGSSGGYEIIDGVAVVPVDGPLMKKMNLMSQISGGTSTDILRQNVSSAALDKAAHAIVLLTDSPGGSTMGIIEAHDAIKSADMVKPVVALTDGVMASAAYWLGSAARAVRISSETNLVGSIGVIYRHIDRSAADAKAGLKITEIYAGKYKTALTDSAPLSEEAQADIQAKVDKLYSLFVDTVARNRGVDSKTVLTHMAEGRIFLGSEAVNAGLVDGVSTLDALIADLNAGRIPARKMFLPPAAGVAAADTQPPQASAGVAPLGNNATQSNSGVTMDKDFILANHPAIAEAFRAEGFALGKADGFAAGAAAELARIQAVEAQLLPGHENLIAALKADGKTTGPEAAVQVLNAERALGASRLGALAADAPNPAPHANAPADKPAADGSAAKAPAKGSAEEFDAAIAANVKAGLSRGKAISKAAHELPEAHAAWIDLRNAA